ncbi:ABC transporter ATP-binding protein [Pseudonocardia endophytica]|uniref:Iron complex transport system ATP-binding protein n=1 Tax=Pseudonocardia endophytica TaxID=401976 RepID=A0A4R1HSG8_PSEEN|nr:ABC transporter ATP-binding protein [Pseudonocardia endophytica]TCK25594.1 iron complex transport system ATP-binding protein [Pseudonocardia endophytica]
MDLALDGLTVALDGREVVRELSLDVASGTVVGLVGPNGSGKSTALRCAYRALAPVRGTVRVDGTDVTSVSLRDGARRLAVMAQHYGSDLDFTVREVVALGRAPHLRGNRRLGPRDHAVCADAMRRVGVDTLADRGVLTLSGGERQRVLAARALAQEPEVLVLDEPTNHLDVAHQLGLLAVLRDSGVTVLVVLHDLNLAATACDRIGVLSDGRLVASGPPAEVLTTDLVEAVFGVRTRVVGHPDTGAPQLLYTLPLP